MPNQYSPRRPAIIPVGPSIAYIELTKGQFARVSREKAEHLSQWNWYAMWSKDVGNFYALRDTRSGVKRQTVSMHGAILGPLGDKLTADHIDRNTLNNCDWNLRAATATEQNINQRQDRNNNKSGVPGVHFARYYQKWQAYINKGGRRLRTSYHHTYDAAVTARRQMEKDFFC